MRILATLGLLFALSCTAESGATESRWTLAGLPSASVNALVFSKADPGTVWAAAKSGLFVSHDGGGSFRRLQGAETMGEFSRFVVHPTRSGEVFAKTSLGSWRSTDGGTSWRVQSEEVLDVDPRSADLYYARRPDGLGVSLDAGTTWTTLTSTAGWKIPQLRVDPGDSRVLHIVVDETEVGRMSYFRSADSGATWTKGPSISKTDDPLFVADVTPTTIYLQRPGTGEFFRSTDGGGSWAALGNGGTGDLWRLAVDPSRPLNVTCGYFEPGGGGSIPFSVLIRTSTDGGTTWKTKSRVPGDTSLKGGWVDPHDGSRIWFSFNASLLSSVDGGSTFSEVRSGLTGAPSKKAVFAGSGESEILALRGDERLFRSADGGASWSEVVEGLPPFVGNTTLAVSSADGGEVFVTRGADLYRSRDSGRTWEKRAAPAGISSFQTLDSCGDREFAQLFLFSSNSSGVFFRSTDSGLTWQSLRGPKVGEKYAAGFSYFGCSPIDRQRIILYSSYGVSGSPTGAFQTRDGGLTWSNLAELEAIPTIPRLTSFVPVFDPARAGTIYFGSRASRNDGQTWEKWISAGGDFPAAVSVNPSDPGQATFVSWYLNGRVENGGCTEVLGRENLFSNSARMAQSLSGRSLLLATDRGLWSRSERGFRTVLPAVASIRGVPPAFFHSDVRVVNPDANATARVRATYRCASNGCGDSTREFEVPPRQEAMFDDIVVSLFGAAGTSGAIEFESDEPITVASRLYTPSRPSATFGQFVPGRAVEEARSSMILPGLSHSADRSTGFRSNIGVFNAGDVEESVSFVLRRPDGYKIGTVTRTVAPHRRVQINDADLFLEVGHREDEPDFYAVVSGSSTARLFVDASVVDNQSQDPVFVAGEDAQVPSYCVEDRIVIPAATSIRGVGGAFFHSDLSLVNRTNAPADLNLRYDCHQPPCGRGSIDLRLGALDQVSLSDAIGEAFGASGSAGAIVIEGSGVASIVAASRLYTPSKPDPTFGQFVPGLRPSRSSRRAVLSLLSRSADPGSGSRTNVGLSNPGDDFARVRLSFFDEAGEPLGAISRDVSPRSWLQINADSLAAELGGLGTVPDFWALVESADGVPVFAYASVVDNLSQDPIFVPAVRLVE